MLNSTIKVKTAILLISNIIDFRNIKMKPQSHKNCLGKISYHPTKWNNFLPSNRYYGGTCGIWWMGMILCDIMVSESLHLGGAQSQLMEFKVSWWSVKSADGALSQLMEIMVSWWCSSSIADLIKSADLCPLPQELIPRFSQLLMYWCTKMTLNARW